MLEEKSTETRLAVIENDIKYIKDKIDSLDFSESFQKQGERIGKVEQDIAVLQSKVKAICWVLGIVGSTAIATLTAEILALIGAK